MSKLSKKILSLQTNIANTEEIFAEEFVPKLHENLLYIVYCVIIEGDKVLLIRESKAPYHGKFYLPAGKADRHESLTVSCSKVY